WRTCGRGGSRRRWRRVSSPVGGGAGRGGPGGAAGRRRGGLAGRFGAALFSGRLRPEDGVGQGRGVVVEVVGPLAHRGRRAGGRELGDGLSAILAAHRRSSGRAISTSVGRSLIDRDEYAGIRFSAPASRVCLQSVSSVRTTVVAGRSASTYRKISEVATRAREISMEGNSSTSPVASQRMNMNSARRAAKAPYCA